MMYTHCPELHRKDRVAAFTAALLIFIALPFVFTSKKAPAPQRTPRKHVTILAETEKYNSPALEKQLYYQDPTAFLFADDTRSFGLFRVLERTPLLIHTPESNLPVLVHDTFEPVSPDPLTDNSMQYLPRLYPAVPDDKTEVPVPQTTYPVLMTSTGNIIPCQWDLSQNKTMPSAPTRIRIYPPISDEMSCYAGLEQSCGDTVLDQTAVQCVDRLLFSGKLSANTSRGFLTVYWALPELPETTDDNGGGKQ